MTEQREEYVRSLEAAIAGVVELFFGAICLGASGAMQALPNEATYGTYHPLAAPFAAVLGFVFIGLAVRNFLRS